MYSVYTASSLHSGSGRNGTAALVGKSKGGTAGEVYSLYSYASAAEQFGEGDSLTGLAQLLMRNGAARVLAVPLGPSAGAADYAAAFQRLEMEEGVKVLLCDSLEEEIQTELRESVERVSKEKRERIGVAAGPEGVSALTARALALHCERMVLTAPAGWKWLPRRPGPSAPCGTRRSPWAGRRCWGSRLWRGSFRRRSWTPSCWGA